jgi:hypothetical protein
MRPAQRVLHLAANMLRSQPPFLEVSFPVITIAVAGVCSPGMGEHALYALYLIYFKRARL